MWPRANRNAVDLRRCSSLSSSLAAMVSHWIAIGTDREIALKITLHSVLSTGKFPVQPLAGSYRCSGGLPYKISARTPVLTHVLAETVFLRMNGPTSSSGQNSRVEARYRLERSVIWSHRRRMISI